MIKISNLTHHAWAYCHAPGRGWQRPRPSPVDRWRGAPPVEPGSSHQSGDRAAHMRFSTPKPPAQDPLHDPTPDPNQTPDPRTVSKSATKAAAAPMRRYRTAESCGFISATRTAQRPLWQIWTPCVGPVSDSGPVSGHGEGPGPGASGC